MAVIASEMVWRYSTTSSHQAASAAATSLGKYVSSTLITSGSLNNLFPDITAANNNNTLYYYRCIYLHNTNVSSTVTSLQASIARSFSVAGATDIEIALDPNNAGSILYSANSISAWTTSGTAAPTQSGGAAGSITWVPASPTASVGGSITMAANGILPIWLRSQGNNTAASAETITLSWTGTAV